MKNNTVHTFGCRLNSYESEVIKNNMEEAGMDNVAVFNTCAVTKEAERQARQSIRKFIRENPDKKVIVTGCSAQINPKQYEDIEGVHKIIGNEEKLSKDTYIGAQESLLLDSETEKVLVNDIFSVTETAHHLISGLEDRSRAFMQVQNGCDHRCTFCIIPYGRGNSRSVPVGEVVSQVKLLVSQGYNEVVFTGVDLTDYGSDLPGNPKLGQLAKRVLSLVPELQRLRLSSVDVAEIDDDIFWLLENEQRFMPYFHLSLQAGDNMILKRMKRRHTREQTVEFCNKVKEIRPDISFGADIIAGFPTESDEMFENSLRIISECGIIHGHIFPYSEREGTPAAKIPTSKQVPNNIRKERAKLMREACESELQKFLKSRIGKQENIVVEKDGFGTTEHLCRIKLPEDNDYKIGEVIQLVPTKVQDNYLI